MPKKQVGLVLMTDLTTGRKVRLALLHVRGQYDLTGATTTEEWPGVSDITVVSDVGQSEEIEDVLFRQAAELYEYKFYKEVYRLWRAGKILKLADNRDTTYHTILYGGIIDWQWIREIRLSPSSGGIRLLPQNELDDIISTGVMRKHDGLTDRRNVGMFPTGIQAVRLAFEKLT